MNLDEIIDLFKRIEAGKEGQKLNMRLHYGIRQATQISWCDSEFGPKKFSEFLSALKDHEKV